MNKTEKERAYQRFLEKLQAAITLAGGGKFDNLGQMTIERIYDELYPNGIELNVKLLSHFNYES